MSNDCLTIIGAGPKAMAIATKAFVLKNLGFSVPKIRILEKDSIGSFWKNQTGFTNGRQKLGTAPEKDLGFPYASSCWGDEFNQRVNHQMQQFAWSSFLIEHGHYCTWIDRGKPQPEHRQWAEYLQWAYEKISCDRKIEFVRAEFDSLDFGTHQNWKIQARDQNGGELEFETDGIVLTGPGEMKIPSQMSPQALPQVLPQVQPQVQNDERILNIRTFWKWVKDFKEPSKDTYIAVIGTGETAASVAVTLGKLEAPIHIDIITPMAMSYSRGESFVENNMYTDPFKGNWHELTYEDRKNFIERTDRGVFSISTKKELDQMSHVEIIPGWFNTLAVNSANQLVVELQYNERIEHRVYDFVVLSVGFDPLQFLSRRMTQKARETLLERSSLREWSVPEFEKNIAEDLSVKNLLPKLHLPMIAGLQQGPGFPNLSCLGRLADQILTNYVALDLA